MSNQENSKKRKANHQISKSSKKRKYFQEKNVEKLIEKTNKKKELENDKEDTFEEDKNERKEIQNNDEEFSDLEDENISKKSKKGMKLLEDLETVENPFTPITSEKETKSVSNSSNLAKKRKFTKGKEKEEQHLKDIDRTVFIGNVPFRPIIENPEKLKKRLIQFFGGSEFVESIRLRNLPVIIDENDAKKHKQPSNVAKLTAKMSRDSKIHLNQFRTRDLKFDNDYYEVTAYAKLNSVDIVQDFMKKFNKANFEDSILFVDHATSEGIQYDERVQNKTAVLGGLPAYIKTKDLYDAFKEVEGIHSIRVVRDPVTRLSRGIAYVHFLKKKLCNSFLSNYKEINYLGKTIRIMRFEVDKKEQEKNKQQYRTKANRFKTKEKQQTVSASESLRAKHIAEQYKERVNKLPEKYWQGNQGKEKVTSKHKKIWKKFQ